MARLVKKLESKIIFLILFFFIGVLLRLIFLNEYPRGFHSQEAILGYRAYSLVSSGKDELRRSWPLIFTSFQDYQLPLPTYLVAASVKLFNLSVFSVRLPFALFGVFGIIAVFGITRKLFPNREDLAYFTSFLMAISPWSVFLSRIAFPEGLGFALFLIGLDFYLCLKQKFSFPLFLGAALFWLACLYTTKTAWFFLLPFIFISSLRRSMPRIDRKTLGLVAVVTILFLPLFFNYLNLPAMKRSFVDNDLSLFSDISISNGINSMRGAEVKSGIPLLGKLFYNKGFWLIKYFERFLAHFSPAYYFAVGDQNSLHGLWNFGPLYLILIVPGILGVWLMLHKKEEKGGFFLFWFSLAAATSALVKNSPDQTKLIFALPVLLIIISFGLEKIFQSRWRFLFMAILIFNIFFVGYDAVYKESLRAERDWFYGFAQVAKIISDNNYQKFTKVYLTDGYAPDPAPFFLFWGKYSPLKLQSQSSLFGYHYWINQIGNIQIGRVKEFSLLPKEKALFIVTPEEEKNLLSKVVILDKENKPSGKLCYQIDNKIKGLEGKEFLLVATTTADNCILAKGSK